MTSSEHDRDLALAAQLQAALLPKACPGDCPHQETGARNRMCQTVGGDFYDFLHINDEQIVIVIGDVIGHGVRASLLMAKIMGALRADAQGRSRPASAVSALNRMLIDLGDQVDTILSCSLLYTVIDLPTGMGFLINAGHPPPVICDRTKCLNHQVGQHDMVLGVEAYEPRELCHTFTPGERLVLFTDGIIEAANEAQELFGRRRLLGTLNDCADAGPQQTADAVLDAVDAFRNGAPQSDDETIVVVDRL